jgi:uncharacterized delta-60 repeat protein
MKKIAFILLGLTLFSMTCTVPVYADLVPGQPDSGFDPGSAVDNEVVSIALQPDGKTLIGGRFTKGIARLNRDGSLDTSFAVGSGTNALVTTILIQPDGKLIISGDFTEFNGVECNKIARLNIDGSLDASFSSGTGTNTTIIVSTLQQDGKVLIAGEFTNYDGNAVYRVARLNTDGSLDPFFDPGTGPNGLVRATTLQPDGRILIAGSFTMVNGINRNRIARLNINGSLDVTFIPGDGPDAEVRSVVLQPDGKVLIGGVFTLVDGNIRNRVARLNENGKLDISFEPIEGTNNYINVIALQSDGKILLSGEFHLQKGTLVYDRIARFESNGALDTTFFSAANPNNQIRTILLYPNGKFIIGGAFSEYAGITRNNIARINSDGSLDSAFNTWDGTDSNVYALAVQPDGKIIVGGVFSKIAGISRKRIGRLYANGAMDFSFNAGTDIDDGYVIAVALQPDGKVLIGGSFSGIDGGSCRGVGRLNSNGSLDASFDAACGSGIGESYQDVKALVLDKKNKIIIGGSFTSYDNTRRNRIARINSDGTVDEKFDPGSGANGAVAAIAVQPDGKVIIGGLFTSVNGIARNRIARFNSDGSVDKSFDPGSGVGARSVNAIALQEDGKVLIGGNFSIVDGTTRVNIARLNEDGSLDKSFETQNGGTNDWVLSIVVQDDGKVLIGGSFTMVNDVSMIRVARLNTDGSLDFNFNPGAGPDATVWALAFQRDGNLVIGGNFSFVACYSHNHIARLNASTNPIITSDLPPSSAKEGTNYFHIFTAIGHPAVSLFQVTAGKLPKGLALDSSTGLLSGKITEAGEFVINIEACNFVGPCDSQNVTITVEGSPAIYLPLIIR